MSKNDPLFTSFLPKDWPKLKKCLEAPSSWFEAVLQAARSKEELAALGLLSILIPEDPSVATVELIPLDSLKGKELFEKMCQGSIKKKGYEELLERLKTKSSIEKIIFRLSFQKPSSMKEFNQFVLRGAFYEGDSIIHLMPFALHELLKIQFGEDIQPLTTLFGYSTSFEDFCYDQRPISIPCTSFPVPFTIHGVRASHPIEVFLHDTAHQILSAHIPKAHRLRFQAIGRELYQKGEKEMAIYLVDMPFVSYLDLPQDLAFDKALTITTYRAASSCWQNEFITELISGVLSERFHKQLNVNRLSDLSNILQRVVNEQSASGHSHKDKTSPLFSIK